MGWIDNFASFDRLRMRSTEAAIGIRGHEEICLILSPSKDAGPSCSPTPTEEP